MSTLETLLIVLAAAALLAVAAERLGVPYAVALVGGGVALALLPGVPAIELDPALALALFLPPFLQLSAQRTDWQAFTGALGPIIGLALGAVIFTAVLVGGAAKLMIPQLPWGAAIALGAIVAPPDAVAAAAVLKEMPIPKRIVTVLEGESLLNDASSLILYRFAVAATAAGTVDLGQAGSQFVLSALGGAAIGWAVGRIAVTVLAQLENSLIETLISVLSAYAAYLAAEHFHVSGVLGAVMSGLMLGRSQHAVLSARVRLESNAVWNFIEFVLTSFVFVLIGLQLRGLIARLERFDTVELAVLAAVVTGTLIASRFLWIFGVSTFARRASRAVPRGPRELAVVSWAGMRGVVSLAAALALPLNFPGRDIIVFLAFCAIFATLVLQGATLGWVIRRLRVFEAETQDADSAERTLRRRLTEAELAVVVGALAAPNRRALAQPLLPEFRDRLLNAIRLQRDAGREHGRQRGRLELRLAAVLAARRVLGEHRRQLDTERLRLLEEELDHREAAVRNALAHSEPEHR